MNQVTLIGRLVRDPKTNEARTVASFTVAVDRMKKDDGADFINCKAFGKTAENVLKYCCKGKPVAILGRIQTGSYEGRDGKTVYTTDVIADRVEFLPKDSTQAAPKQDDEYPGQRRVQAELDGTQAVFAALDEDVPF